MKQEQKMAKGHACYSNGVENKMGAISERDFNIFLENKDQNEER